jgi:hypothetical protein
MAQSPWLESGVDRSSAQRAFTLQSAHQRRGGEPPASDERIARLTRANLFVVGADDVVAQLVSSLWPYLEPPVVVRRRGEPLRLVPTSRPVGTIVVYDVDTLTHDEQQVLNLWVCAGNGHSRVVSTASTSLLPMVEAGLFDDALYYRLNVVTIDLTSPIPR